MQLAFPSSDLPGPVALTLDVPDDWEWSPAPGLSLVAVAPSVEGRFRPNVNVTHARISGQHDLPTLAAAARAKLEAELLSFDSTGDDAFGSRDGAPAVVREFAFLDPGSELALFQVQMQVLCALPGGVADLVTITATCAGGQLDRVESLRDVIRSVRLIAS